LQGTERYALDTEFHRERTYWPVLALVQVAWEPGGAGPGGVAIIDPLAVDVQPLRDLLAGPRLMVAHAAEQDLEILERACGVVPSRLLDTQIAAGFCGYPSASLNALTQAFLGVSLAKGDRLSDWRTRPLTPSQMRYAAADVDHLIDLAAAIDQELVRRDRKAWADEECESLRARPHGPPDPEQAWWKLRDSRALRGDACGVAQEVAAWRERTARALDIPVRTVLADLAVQAIAHRPPASMEALNRTRGMEGRHLRAALAAALLEAIERGKALPADRVRLPPIDDVPKDLRPPVALIMAWVAQLARDERIDPALLATRSDVAAFLRGDPAARLARGWRENMLAGPITALVEGRAGLAFNGQGGLVLEERSGRPWRLTERT
jgi:ribonuclease D